MAKPRISDTSFSINITNTSILSTSTGNARRCRLFALCIMRLERAMRQPPPQPRIAQPRRSHHLFDPAKRRVFRCRLLVRRRLHRHCDVAGDDHLFATRFCIKCAPAKHARRSTIYIGFGQIELIRHVCPNHPKCPLRKV